MFFKKSDEVHFCKAAGQRLATLLKKTLIYRHFQYYVNMNPSRHCISEALRSLEGEIVKKVQPSRGILK